MMGNVSPETRQASYKYGIIKFDTLLHLVGFSLWKWHLICWMFLMMRWQDDRILISFCPNYQGWQF
jgi:hypothetical protein